MVVRQTVRGLKTFTLDEVLANFKTEKSNDWATLRLRYTSDLEAENVLKEFFRPLVTSGETHYISTVRDRASQMIVNHIEELNAQRSFKLDYAFDQLQVQIVSQESDFPRGIQWKRVGQDCDIKTRLMQLDVKIAVHSLQPDEVAKWKVGFVQTIMRLERRIIIVKGNVKAFLKTWIPGSCKDGPKDYAECWYDPKSVAQLQPKKFQIVEVSMKDQPGLSWGQKLDETIEVVDGGEAFQTWLVMQRTDNSKTQFLRMWAWHVDYTIEPANVERFGIVFDGYQQNANGVGAVLTGLSGKNLFKSEFRQERSNVLSFDEIREMSLRYH